MLIFFSTSSKTKQERRESESHEFKASHSLLYLRSFGRVYFASEQVNQPSRESERLFLSFVASNLHQIRISEMRDGTSLLNTHTTTCMHISCEFMHIERKWWVWIVASLIVLMCVCVRVCISFKCIFVNFYFCNSYRDFLFFPQF